MDILRDLSHMDRYVPGKGLDEVAKKHGLDIDEVVKLSSNENPLGVPEKARKTVREKIDEVNKYPTHLHTKTREAVADAKQVPEDNLVLDAGGDGVLDTIGRALMNDGDKVLTPTPGFSYYGMSSRNLGGKENSYDITKDEGFGYDAENILEVYDGEKIVYVTSPNNPTGTAAEKDTVKRIAEGIDGLLVVDEAYVEFTERESYLDLALKRDDVAVVRTFSKAYGMAGLRVGYGVLPDWLADIYPKVVTPFSVGTLSLYAAQAAVESRDHLERSVELARRSRRYMTENIELPVYESEANFILVDVSPVEASKFTEELEKRGVVVRDTSSFGLPRCIRVSAGKKNETQRAVDEINDVYRKLTEQ